jgi:hypothetical protein
VPAVAQTALNSVTVACQACAWLVANTAKFQEIVSVDTAPLAYEHVYWPEANDYDPDYPEALVDPRPRAIVSTLEWGWEGQGQGEWRDSGSLALSFEFLVPPEYDGNRREEQLWFDNAWGTIVRQMFDLRGQHDADGHALLFPTSMRTLMPPMPSERGEDIEYFYGVALLVTWPN